MRTCVANCTEYRREVIHVILPVSKKPRPAGTVQTPTTSKGTRNMFLMVLIFLLIVLFTGLQNFVKEITAFVGRRVFFLSDDELDLRAKVRDMKDQLSHISMMDEFARYMRLQRQIDKLAAQVKEGGTTRQKKMAMLRMGVMIGLHVLHAVVMLSLVLSHRSEPLVMLPEGWFFPVQKLVALPSGVTGGVGIVCWIVVCNSVVHRAKQLLV